MRSYAPYIFATLLGLVLAGPIGAVLGVLVVMAVKYGENIISK